MAANFFLKVEGVEGEATQKGFEKQLELLSFSIGGSNISHTSGGGMAKGAPVTRPCTVVRYADKASMPLAKSMFEGKHWPKATLSCLKSGEGQWVYQVYNFTELMLNDIQVNADSSGALVETVTFSYNKVEVKYTAQNEKGGKTGESQFSWDDKLKVAA